MKPAEVSQRHCGRLHHPVIRLARPRSGAWLFGLAVDALGVDPEQDGDAAGYTRCNSGPACGGRGRQGQRPPLTPGPASRSGAA